MPEVNVNANVARATAARANEELYSAAADDAAQAQGAAAKPSLQDDLSAKLKEKTRDAVKAFLEAAPYKLIWKGQNTGMGTELYISADGKTRVQVTYDHVSADPKTDKFVSVDAREPAPAAAPAK